MLPRLSKVEVRKCGLPSRGNVTRNSIHKDIHQESIGQRKVMKYLRESCYHRIEYSVANSLAPVIYIGPGAQFEDASSPRTGKRCYGSRH